VVFPEENHWVLKGENSRLFYQEIRDWLSRWLVPEAASGATTSPVASR
jgi:dipeptidyl aminopeptidase/acylaminoacyl peptidase